MLFFARCEHTPAPLRGAALSLIASVGVASRRPTAINLDGFAVPNERDFEVESVLVSSSQKQNDADSRQRPLPVPSAQSLVPSSMPRRRNRRRSAKRARGSSDRRGCRSRRRAWDGAFSTDHPIARISGVANVSYVALLLHRRARGRRPLISQLIDVSIKLAKDVANLLKCFLRRPHNAPPYLLQYASAKNARELPPLKKTPRPHIACDTYTTWVIKQLRISPTSPYQNAYSREYLLGRGRELGWADMKRVRR